MKKDTKAERIKELERQIADLESRLPQHSLPPAMLIELEELEEALERARSERARAERARAERAEENDR
jgi:hypothetical protein